MPKSRVETEELLKEGCRRLLCEKRNGIKINIKQTAFDLNIPYTTLRSRFLNIHKPAQEAHTTQQFLSPSQERLLVKWIEHLGLTGRPLCKRTIRINANIANLNLPIAGPSTTSNGVFTPVPPIQPQFNFYYPGM